MLSNNTFLETRIQRLLDGLFFAQKGLGVHVQRMLEMSRDFILAEILSKIHGKRLRKFGDLICDHDLTNKRFGASLFFIKIYIMRSLLARLLPLHWENVD